MRGRIACSMDILRSLATSRTMSQQVLHRYDPVRQVSQVHEDECWVDSWQSTTPPRTKKADRETGEDQKGH